MRSADSADIRMRGTFGASAWHCAPCIDEELGDLSGFARSRLSYEDHHLVLRDRLGEFRLELVHREVDALLEDLVVVRRVHPLCQRVHLWL